jgi:tetratricopeptide (TPR) repeat protein
MNTAVMTGGLARNSFADTALKAAVRFWFVVAVAGQWIFAFYVASYYGSSALRGHLEAWNKTLSHGYMPGDALGNSVLAGHLLFAAAVTFAGVLQLVPQIRARFPVFHRWNGRIFVLVAFSQGIDGLYLQWSGRNLVGGALEHIAVDINAGLIMLCAAMAWRYARARDFATHRRWALRLFLIANGVWFFRLGLMFWLFVNQGPVGFDPTAFTGPFITFLIFAQYLLPLAVLEVYLRAQARGSAPARVATAAGLSALTIVMAIGIFSATMGMWLPKIKTAYDGRTSIAETVSATIASSGIEAATRQYQDLKAARPTNYNFDEDELNALGYQLLRTNKFKEAIRILQLNVDAYPRSGNVYDSLGEAYMDDGDKAQSIANYQKSLQLNPNNANAVKMLKKLDTP